VPRRYILFRSKDKHLAFENALKEAGHKEVSNLEEADFLLIDEEREASLDLIETATKNGVPIFIYPHGASEEIVWDGIRKSYPVRANFVFGEGQKRTMEAYGYKYPIIVVGWPYSEILPFHPCEPRTILFAPSHVVSTGYPRTDFESNPIVVEQLLALSGNYDKLIVRLGGTPEEHNLAGFWNSQKIIWQQAILKIRRSIQAIKEVDLVISIHTFGYIAVALGKPTLFYMQDIPPHDIDPEYVLSFGKYKDFRMFPANFDGKWETLLSVTRHNEKVEEWRRQFIGRSFDKRLFLNTIERGLKR